MKVKMVLRDGDLVDHFEIEASATDMLTISAGLRTMANDEERHYSDRMHAKKLFNEIHKSYERRDDDGSGTE